MTISLVGREPELARIREILALGTDTPAFLCVTGGPGIGKTALFDAGCAMAAGDGYTVLRSAPSSVESHLSFAGLTDLLEPLADRLESLPSPQQLALEAALLRRTRMGRLPDARTVAAGTLSLLQGMCSTGTVLIAVDDVQWLDEPSSRAMSFALRRLRAPHVALLTLREGHRLPFGPASDAAPGGGLALEGLGAGPLHEFLRRSGHPVNRAELNRIHSVSAGNPLFARELALGLSDSGSRQTRPGLTAEMQERYRRLPAQDQAALLLACCVADPTAALFRDVGLEQAAAILASAEEAGIVAWNGGQLQFAHPMWREVAYREASPGDRRAAHAALSAVTDDLEERARHLALSSPFLDAPTRAALEDAATSARLRGAPWHAAELLGLAIERGANEPSILLQAAQDNFAAGSHEAARRLSDRVLAADAAAPHRAAALNLLGGITYLTDDFPQAIAYLQRAYDHADDDPVIRAGIAIDLAFACANLGRNPEGLLWTARAEAAAAEVDEVSLTAEAAGAAAVLVFLTGGGVDRRRLERALAGEDPDRPSTPVRWPSMSVALVQLWSGDLDRARPALLAIRRRFDERGIDTGLPLLLARLTEAAILDGDVEAATSLVAQIEEHAQISGGEAEAAMALGCRVVLAGYIGDANQARIAHNALIGITGGTRHLMTAVAATAALGMCQLSAGDPDAAAAQLAPVADLVLMLGVGEPVVSPFFADAAEALVAVGRPEAALPLVEFLEAWGSHSGCAWPCGAGARARACLLLGQGDLQAAGAALDRALEAFEPQSYRYERARTLLLVGTVRRRLRRRSQAYETLGMARDVFSDIGALGWKAYAEREIDRLGLQHRDNRQLTASEQRIATLAASGLTNAVVAERLSISTKTVEAHLNRIYGKLGIRSRAELGQWMAHQT